MSVSRLDARAMGDADVKAKIAFLAGLDHLAAACRINLLTLGAVEIDAAMKLPSPQDLVVLIAELLDDTSGRRPENAKASCVETAIWQSAAKVWDGDATARPASITALAQSARITRAPYQKSGSTGSR